MKDDQNYFNSISESNFLPEGEKNSDKQDKVKQFPKYKKYITWVDPETGEIKGHFPCKSRGLGTGWVGLYQEASINLAKANLPNEQNRVIFYLLGKLDFENYLRISQKQMSQDLNMKQPHISRALKALEERYIIVEGPRAGLNKTYRLNPYIAHKGQNKLGTIEETAFSKLTLVHSNKDREK